LSRLQRDLRKLPLRHPSRPQVSDAVQYLKAGFPELKAEYARRNAEGRKAPKKGTVNELHQEVIRLRKKLDEMVSQTSASLEKSKHRAQTPAEAEPTNVKPASLETIESPAKQPSWENIEIVFLSDECVQIHTPAKTETLTYSEFGGFEDRRSE